MDVYNIMESKCLTRRCKYYRALHRGKHHCFAFPHGIPDEINFGDNEHLNPIKGQRGDFVFTVGTSPKIIAPYPCKSIESPTMHGRDNLCSTIRDIYMKSEDEEIKLWCRIAMSMSKNMYKALKIYKEMLMEKGVKVDHDTREDWQLRGLSKNLE